MTNIFLALIFTFFGCFSFLTYLNKDNIHLVLDFPSFLISLLLLLGVFFRMKSKEELKNQRNLKKIGKVAEEYRKLLVPVGVISTLCANAYYHSYNGYPSAGFIISSLNTFFNMSLIFITLYIFDIILMFKKTEKNDQ